MKRGPGENFFCERKRFPPERIYYNSNTNTGMVTKQRRVLVRRQLAEKAESPSYISERERMTEAQGTEETTRRTALMESETGNRDAIPNANSG